jgi:putative oxidoreductase
MNALLVGPVPAVGRLLMAVIFILGGWGKLMAPAGVAEEIAKLGLPLPELGAWVAVVTELAGGLLILFGFVTRPVAAWLAFWCLVTGFLVHFVPGNQNMMIHLMKNICMAGGFLQLASYGPGTWSIDAMLQRRPAALRPAE